MRYPSREAPGCSQAIASGGEDRVVRVWLVDGEEVIKSSHIEFKGHKGEITALAANAVVVCSGSRDGTVRVWTTRALPSEGPCLAILGPRAGRSHRLHASPIASVCFVGAP